MKKLIGQAFTVQQTKRVAQRLGLPRAMQTIPHCLKVRSLPVTEPFAAGAWRKNAYQTFSRRQIVQTFSHMEHQPV